MRFASEKYANVGTKNLNQKSYEQLSVTSGLGMNSELLCCYSCTALYPGIQSTLLITWANFEITGCYKLCISKRIKIQWSYSNFSSMERSETGVWFEFSKQRRCTSFWVSCEYCLGKPQEWWHWYVKRKLKLMNFLFSHLLNIVPIKLVLEKALR